MLAPSSFLLPRCHAQRQGDHRYATAKECQQRRVPSTPWFDVFIFRSEFFISYDPRRYPAGVPPGRPVSARVRSNQPSRCAWPGRCAASAGRPTALPYRSDQRLSRPVCPWQAAHRALHTIFRNVRLPSLVERLGSADFEPRRDSCPARGVPRVRNTLEPFVRSSSFL